MEHYQSKSTFQISTQAHPQNNSQNLSKEGRKRQFGYYICSLKYAALLTRLVIIHPHNYESHSAMICNRTHKTVISNANSSYMK